MAIALNDRVEVVSEQMDRLGARATPGLLAAVRIMTGLVWLQNAGWKTPPDFGKATKSGLYRYTHTAIDAPVLDPFTCIVRHLVLPNWTLFGWMTLLAEATIGALLILGLWTILEWDYGIYEGVSTPEARLEIPDWSVWAHSIIGGETVDAVGDRADSVIRRIVEANGDVVVFAHGHFLRILAARWLGLPVDAGRHHALNTATVSTLGFE